MSANFSKQDEQALARLAQLESRRANLFRLLIAFVVVTVVVGLRAIEPSGKTAPSDKEIEATRFVLRDKKGTVRGGFAVVDGTASLQLFDGKQRPRISLNASDTEA